MFIATIGGIAQNGGVGQAVRNLLTGFNLLPARPSVRVIDTWHVEWSLKISLISPLYFAAACLRVVFERLRGRLALLHLNMVGGASMLRKSILTWIGVSLRVPVVVHIHLTLDRSFSRLPDVVQNMFKRTLQQARFVIVLGGSWRELFEEKYDIASERIIVIPNGVPKPALRRPKEPQQVPLLIALGRLGYRKGTPVLLSALADPRVARLPWRAVLAGDGDVDTMLRRAVDLQISERCTFPGWIGRDQVEQLLSQAEIFALPSNEEGLPIALLEAMAYGLAIVTTRAGVIEDAVRHQQEALLVPPGDPNSLAEALLELLNSPALRQRLGQAAAERYAREFTCDVYAERIAAVYRRCGVVVRSAAG